MALRKYKRVPFDISERRRAERQAMEITSDLIHAAEPGELGRKAFEHVKSDLGLMVCTNYRLDPAAQRLRLEFVHGIPLSMSARSFRQSLRRARMNGQSAPKTAASAFGTLLPPPWELNRMDDVR
jgi:hypothetical protein